ncbi:hypothetical protein Q4591_03770 [Shewanella sp. 3_MG-2023]|uniref:hypothetical protein n=1 Tax=Shewanella sp. 3_MG-2023 TaxID=3062635 RepID=UPI0026E2B5D6|nr:hypothetical protein [Shewanella sp. 3_MG-2023]MDO6774462.1 hypothetical protein [Shewanella sp. 3_MG-2023]
MTLTKDEKLAVIQKKMTMVAVIDFPGTLLMAAGLYGLFAGFDTAAYPMLANPILLFAMVGVGGCIMVWGLLRMMQLAREKQGVLSEPS